jgi:hypothetical protein
MQNGNTGKWVQTVDATFYTHNISIVGLNAHVLSKNMGKNLFMEILLDVICMQDNDVRLWAYLFLIRHELRTSLNSVNRIRV